MHLLTSQIVAVDEYNRVVMFDLNGFYTYGDKENTYSFLKRFGNDIDIDFHVFNIDSKGNIVEWVNHTVSKNREDFKDILRAMMSKMRFIFFDKSNKVTQASINEYSKMFYYEYEDDPNRVRFVLIHGDMGNAQNGSRLYWVSTGDMIYSKGLEIVYNGTYYITDSKAYSNPTHFLARKFTDNYIARECDIGYDAKQNICWTYNNQEDLIHVNLTELT